MCIYLKGCKQDGQYRLGGRESNPLLKKDTQMGAKELQEELKYKYKIETPTREAVEAAARQEAVAARLAFSATKPHDEVMDVMALDVVVPDASNEIPRARRYCPSRTNIGLLVSGLIL